MKQAILRWKTPVFDISAFVSNGTRPHYSTGMGALFAGDCAKILPKINAGIVDTVFADPPFNLGKKYRENTNDSLPELEYVGWCKSWVKECVRVLKPGGSLFIYNLPKWNIPIGAYLNELGMEFRHWIGIEISACLPIPGRLHPSHYSLLYYSKGKPNTFRRYGRRFAHVAIAAARLRTTVGIARQ